MVFDRKWLIIIVAVIIIFLLCFRGITQTVKAVTVSTNDIKEKNNEDRTDSVSVVLDDPEDVPAPEAVDTPDSLESGEAYEDPAVASGEDGQSVYMDQEFADSVLDYLNWSYKADLAVIVLLGFLCGIFLAVLVMQFYMK